MHQLLTKTFQYRPILVHKKCTSIDRYWNTKEFTSIDQYWYTKTVPVSTDTGTRKLYQYRPILEHFCRTSIDRYWYIFTFQYRTILAYQYLGPKVHFFQLLVIIIICIQRIVFYQHCPMTLAY